MRKRADSHPTHWVLGAVALLIPAMASAQLAPVAIRAATPAAESPSPPAAAPSEEADEYRGAADPLLDSTTEALLRRAHTHVASKEWNEVVEIYDEILASVSDRAGRVVTQVRRRRAPPPGQRAAAPDGEAPGEAEAPESTFRIEDAVVSSDGILYRPIDVTVRAELLRLPEEARDLYRRTHQAAANERLAAARAQGGEAALEALRRLAVRYPLTAAGRTAWHLLGLRLLDAGRTAAAADALETRLTLPFGSEDPPRSDVLAQAVLAHLLSGAQRRGLERLADIEAEASEKTILVQGAALGGHALRTHPLFSRLIESASRAVEITDGGTVWPTARGSFDHSAVRIPEENRPELGSQARWIFPPGAARPDATDAPTPGSPRRALVPGTAAWHGLIFIRGALFGGEVAALDAESGKIEWTATPHEIEVTSRRTRSYGVVGDLGLVVHPLLEEPAKEGGVDSRAASVRRREGALVVGIDRQSQALRQSNRAYRFQLNGLVAYGARSGRLMWRLSREGLDALGVPSLTFVAPPVSSPTVSGGAALVALAISQDSFFLVGVTETGEPRWFRRLYDHDFAGLRSTAIGHGSGQRLAARGRVVLATPGHGICSAVDSQTGDILWASRYRSKIRTRTASPCWIRSAPMLTARLAIVAPMDSDYLTAFELDSGAIAWERRFSNESYHVLGSSDDSIYLVSDRIQAVNLEDGRDAWVTEPFDEALGRPAGEGFLATDALTLPFSSGAIATFSTVDGARTQLIKLHDPRLSTTAYKRLFPVAGRLYGATGEVVYAIESQADSWARMSRERRQNLVKKALLFRAERRFGDALDIYYDLHARYRSRTLRERMEKEVLATVREAATDSGDPEYLTRLLESHGSMVSDPSLRRSFELLEATLLLETEGVDARRRALEKLLRLSTLERVLATSPDDFEVDVATYASDVLRDVRLAGESVPGASPPSEGDGGHLVDETAELSRIVLRASHRERSALALARLIASTPAGQDTVEALSMFDLLLADYPTLAEAPDVLAHGARLVARAAAAHRRKLLPELPAVFTSKQKLERRFWIPAEDGFLVASSPRAPPAPALLAISGAELRAYDDDGAIAFQHELRDYPDVSEVKQHLKSQYEEPAFAYFGEGRLILFAPAGLYGFSYRWSADAPGDDGGDEQRDLAEVKTLRLRWAQPHRHPLLRYNTRNTNWGGLQLPEAQNFFAECGFLEADPWVLLPSGEVYQVGRDTGKLQWRTSLDATPTSGLEPYGAWTTIRTKSPTGLRSIRAEQPGGASIRVRRRFVEGPRNATHEARYVLGGLATVFAGGEFAVIESATGQPLWRKKSYLGRLAFAAGDLLWLSEPGGRLTARSVRSGRVRRTVQLPRGATVIDVLSDPETSPETRPRVAGRAARTLIALGGHSTASRSAPRGVINKVPTGQDLYIIRLNAAGEKVWSSQIHAGAIVYGGSYFHAADGRFILAFNAEGPADKWYTKLVAVDPRQADRDRSERMHEDGSGSRDDEAAVEVASIEISGKGTMLPPRLSLLAGAVGLGNTDGFGRLEPKRIRLEPKHAEQETKDKEPGDPDGTARPRAVDRR